MFHDHLPHQAALCSINVKCVRLCERIRGRYLSIAAALEAEQEVKRGVSASRGIMSIVTEKGRVVYLDSPGA
jgi:hypothetical protein